MVRDIVVFTWCDPCYDQDQETPAVEIPAQFANMKRVEKVAFCEVHLKEILQPVIDVYEKYGQPVDDAAIAVKPKPSKDEQQVCQFPMCGQTLKNRGSLAGHVRGQHGMTLPEYASTYEGAPPPPAPTEELRLECPEPGCNVVYYTPKNKAPRQAMGIHLAKTHGKKKAKKA